MNILFVIPDLEYNGAARQLTLLAAGLPAERFRRRVCVLGRAGPWAQRLAAAGVEVETLGWRHWFDLRPVRQLATRVKDERPDVVHAWRLPALRAVAPALFHRPARLVVSAPLAPGRARPELSRLDRWLLGRADRVAASGPAEAERCRLLGLAAERVAEVPPGVEAVPEGEEAPSEKEIRIACVGPLEAHKGFRDAVWVTDILRHVYPDLKLLLVGQGSERGRLEEALRGARLEGHARLTGEPADVPSLLAGAALVWVPSRTGGGVNVALEAMAAGRAVIASRLPGLAEVVRDGESGLLFPPGDTAALGRSTRRLLDDAELRRRLGEAGRRRAEECFSAAAMVARFARLYLDK